MSTATLEAAPAVETEKPPVSAADTLAASVVILMVMTVAQRIIGFGRGVMFCRWLDPEQLGQWDIAFGFLNLAAPLVVLGLPGSFGRYVEYYRQRGQFHTFLFRTLLVSVVACVIATVAICVWPGWFSRLIFGSGDHDRLVVWLALCLATVILHNCLTSLFIAVRMYRVVTILQFVQSLGFAVISLTLLAIWPAGATTIVIGYMAATLLSGLGAYKWLRPLFASEEKPRVAIPHGAFWSKLLPFAIWMWVTNLLSNLFDVIDRYMIVHHGGMTPQVALEQVGMYHSSRIVPLLFVAVTGLLGSMITPHLCQDWECGRRESVVRRLNLTLKLLSGALLAGSVAVLFLAPLLFGVAFQHKFQGGLEVLPLTLTYCAWMGIVCVTQNYLWCAERAGLGSLPFLVGLLINIGLNLVLLPRYGLEGAVWATTVANLVTLLLTFEFSRWHDMRFEAGTWLLALAPLSLALGRWTALGTFVALAVFTLCGNTILTREQKQELAHSFGQGRERLRLLAAKFRGGVAATATK